MEAAQSRAVADCHRWRRPTGLRGHVGAQVGSTAADSARHGFGLARLRRRGCLAGRLCQPVQLAQLPAAHGPAGIALVGERAPEAGTAAPEQRVAVAARNGDQDPRHQADARPGTTHHAGGSLPAAGAGPCTVTSACGKDGLAFERGAAELGGHSALHDGPGAFADHPRQAVDPEVARPIATQRTSPAPSGAAAASSTSSPRNPPLWCSHSRA